MKAKVKKGKKMITKYVNYYFCLVNVLNANCKKLFVFCRNKNQHFLCTINKRVNPYFKIIYHILLK